MGADGYDAVVVGSGPNGLSAALTLAMTGRKVLVLESQPTIGGGTRTAELTEPGFRHDVCSVVHPTGMASPAFNSMALSGHGLRWLVPELGLSHVFGDGTALPLYTDLARSAEFLGRDARAWSATLGYAAAHSAELLADFFGPLRIPRHPLVAARFGPQALMSADVFNRIAFRDPRTRTVFSSIATHVVRPPDAVATAAVGLLLGMLVHSGGWPLARGGSQAIADALAGRLREFGGHIETDHPVYKCEDLPDAPLKFFDVDPRQFAAIMGERLPARYRGRLGRFRFGPGTFKVDYALSEPIPWSDPHTGSSVTFHIAENESQIRENEKAVQAGRLPRRPNLIGGTPSVLDPTRAPDGKHVAWAYCHVPHGCDVDMTTAVEAEIERCAPGFRDVVIARHTMTAKQYSVYNPNYVGGDINSGISDLRQQFTRPIAARVPYATPVPGVYLCSASTPPGGGVHGMCGKYAAEAAMAQKNSV
ncbi:NAD(P)/FAD-dependent oxidoreductase [Williamsia sp.]|uniref:phytoene desaturase family protein n=1 Tax=Williamsia sp. TaxID=1872085 RepID=UPI002F94B9BD